MTDANANLLVSFGLSPTLTLEDGSSLEALSVVRHVPNRRCVCRAIWQGQPVYVKLFFGAKAKHYAMRDINGVTHFQKANILTPEILQTSELKQPEGFVVIFEEIVAAQNAEIVWANSIERIQLKLAERLMQTLASHHQAGLVQTDMYLKNFLVDGDKIYSIDGDGVRNPGALTNGKSVGNLCQLLSKFDVLMLEGSLAHLIETYARSRAWVVFPSTEHVRARVDAGRRKAANAYADNKVFRQCTDVDVSKTKKTWVAISHIYSVFALPKTAEEADDYFKPDNILKDGSTCTVALVNVSNQHIVIKRYNIKNFWHGINRAFRQTRAAKSWSNSHRLRLLGIETAPPVALIETRHFGLKGKAYFLAEHIDAPNMVDFFKQVSGKALRASAVKQMVQLSYRLYLLKISHGDMKASNIIVSENGKPSLIDLDSMQQHVRTASAEKAHVRDLKRFMRNWKDQPSLYNAFVKVFKVVYVDHAPLQAAQILE